MQTTYSPFIVAEQPNGRATVKTAYYCLNEADFVTRIRKLAERSDDDIDTVEQALEYLDQRYAQRTTIITEAEFREAEGWDRAVLDCAEKLDWYVPPAEDGEE